jgi:flagella synthesis protein FlgN
MAIDVSLLARTLDREVAVLRSFVELLRAEQGALVRGETEQVAANVEPKSQYMLELTRLGEERRRWLAGLNLPNTRDGMERLLRDFLSAEAAPRKTWRQLLELTAIAHQLNSTNGMLISARLGNTQSALNAIFSAARMPGAYGADGGTVSLRTAQQLAVA